MDNGISWGKYPTDINRYMDVFIWFLACFTLGSFVGNLFRNNRTSTPAIFQFNRQRFYLVVIVAILFLGLKLIKLGAIPFFSSDPTIRSTGESLGGVVDFPVRLLTLCAVVAIYWNKRNQKVTYISIIAIGLIANLLLMNRAELLFICFSWLLISFGNQKLKFSTFLKIAGLSVAILFFVVSLLAIFRYGAGNLGKNKSLLELAVWVIHGDLTGALSFGSYVADKIDGNLLLGRYTFGEFVSIVNPNYGTHGADYLRQQFLPDRKTAQSVAVPFNIFIDFGKVGVALFATILGLLFSYLQRSFKAEKNLILYFVFILFFYNCLLSTRNGVFPVTPLVVYYALALNFFFTVKRIGSRNSYILITGQLFFLFTILISLTVGLSRV